ncbi:MAG: alpha/beta hydrolase [Proteobacteria bacterium]|nr:alpha/beta hydrolase [Pseudomonadota bacterium]
MTGLYAEWGGQGARLIVLLHGLGATGAVWHGLCEGIEAQGHRWIAPDFRGHGRSPAEGPFGFGVHAADLARLLAEEDPAQVTVLGHSFGGVVGALWAGGLFGPVPARLVTLGVKQVWSTEEIAGAQAMAARPGKIFATEAEAWERYAKVSGLHGLVPPGAPALARGVRAVKGGFALAMAPGVFGAVGPSIEAILRGVTVPLRMAAGSGDPMVTLAQMRAIDAGAMLLDGLPHNAHVAAPERVLALLD